MSAVPESKRGGIFKRLETDAEYLARLVAAHKISALTTFRGAMLDEVGDNYGIQRRIVESTCD